MNKKNNKSDFKQSNKLEDPLRTEIPVLDKLLGIEPDSSSNFYFEPNQIFVIRGEPGSGKTTLGLQILSKKIEKLANIKSNEHEQNQKLVFISLERDPYEILEYAKTWQIDPGKTALVALADHVALVGGPGRKLLEALINSVRLCKNP